MVHVSSIPSHIINEKKTRQKSIKVRLRDSLIMTSLKVEFNRAPESWPCDIILYKYNQRPIIEIFNPPTCFQ